MNNSKFLLAVATAVGISAVATTAVAAPLPAGTRLTIAPWVNPPTFLLDQGTGCTFGSCFGMGVIAGFFGWTALEPGTDGGIIIGKGQKSGGQELDLTSMNPGEVTASWYFGDYGTFFTAPDATGNVFNDASCTGSGCGSRTTPKLTYLAVWNMAWNALTIPVGSAGVCVDPFSPGCGSVDQIAGIFVKSWTIDPAGTTPRKYELKYDQIVPSVFQNFPFKLTLRGEVQPPGNQEPVVRVNGLATANLITTFGTPVTFTISVSDPDGPAAPTCRAEFTGPVNGMVTLNGCTSGTYTSDTGFVGTNSFNVIANDSQLDSIPANGGVVNVVGDLPPTPSISPTPTGSPTNWPSPTPCTDQFPIKQVTLVGQQGHLSVVVTGNITFANPNGKEIKICPTTTATYEASTNTPGATVVCKVKSHVSQGKGKVKVNDHVKCSDRPVGNDKVHFKIKKAV
jgi:hypothetical protein